MIWLLDCSDSWAGLSAKANIQEMSWACSQFHFWTFGKGAHHLGAMLGLLSWCPVESLLLIWRWGNCRWNLQVPQSSDELQWLYTGLILGLGPANERRCYKVTPSLIGGAQNLESALFTHFGLVTQYGDMLPISIGSGNGLSPDGTKPSKISFTSSRGQWVKDRLPG